MKLTDNFQTTLGLITEPGSNRISQDDKKISVKSGLNSVTVQNKQRSISKESVNPKTPNEDRSARATDRTPDFLKVLGGGVEFMKNLMQHHEHNHE